MRQNFTHLLACYVCKLLPHIISSSVQLLDFYRRTRHHLSVVNRKRQSLLLSGFLNERRVDQWVCAVSSILLFLTFIFAVLRMTHFFTETCASPDVVLFSLYIFDHRGVLIDQFILDCLYANSDVLRVFAVVIADAFEEN